MGGGGNSSSSSSRPLTGPQRSQIYQSALADFAGSAPDLFSSNGKGYQVNVPEYEAPTYSSAGNPLQIAGGDLNALQQQMTSGYTSGLDYSKAKDETRANADLARRGVWSSGIAEKAIQDVDASYAPQYAKAGADATNAAFNLQNSQNQSINQLNQQAANSENTFNLANASAENQSQWAPLNFLQGIWNGTGGAISNGSSGGFSFNI